MDWSNWEGSVVDWGNWEVVAGNTESKVVSNIVDSVNSSLISISVRSGDTSISVALLLLGRVDVLVSISKVAKLILSLELGADRTSNWGSNRSSSIGNWSSSNRGSSICSRGSSISSRGSSIGDRGSSISSRGNSRWNCSNSWRIGSSILSTNNWSSSSKGRGSSNWASSQGTSIESSDGSSICKLSVNRSSCRGSI